jgi:acetylornithine/N-succinyldiaminopimelate aminotransferase
MEHVMTSYARLPITFERGEGVWLWDDRGNKYLDAVAGVAVNGLGHCHPKLVRAICEQAGKLIHSSNLYNVALQEKLAARLCDLSGMDSVFFCNSGAEANETAIKLARKYGNERGVSNPSIVVMEKSFHGRTLAALSASGSRKAQAGFEPLVQGFVRVPYNDFEAVQSVARNDPSIVAVLAEVIQGESGVNLARIEYLHALRKLCDEKGWLLMIDEVQTGIGRTGKWFGHQHAGILPDVMPLAKGLGGGVPIGACLARGVAAKLFKPGSHGSTFGGNPLVCAAALATLDTMAEEKLLENAVRVGEFIRAQVREAIGNHPSVVEIRGQGLMIGIELDRPCGELVTQGLTKGILINVAGDTTVRLIPPLVMSLNDATHLLGVLLPMIQNFIAQPKAA